MDNTLNWLNSFSGKIGICIQARLSSTRLPGKVLFSLGSSGYNSLSLMIRRLRYSYDILPLLSNYYILTTDSDCDNAIINESEQLGVTSFQGSQDDVLSRFYLASRLHDLDVIIRLTADCPFIDPVEILRLLKHHLTTGADYTTNTFEGSSIVDGFDVEIFNFNSLHRAYIEAKLPSEREHVSFFFRDKNGFLCNLVDPNLQYSSNFRLTLDTSDDYKVINNMTDYFNDNIVKVSMNEIIDAYEFKKFYLINSHLKKNHGWESAFQKDQLNST